MSHPLLVRHPDPKATESLLGYILRLTETNGYSSPWSIYQFAGMTQGEVRTSGMTPEKLAPVVGEHGPRLKQLSLAHASKGPRWCQLLGQELNPTHVDVLRSKVCPQCVKELGIIEAQWHLIYMVACPLHLCEAVSTCWSCGERLTWYRPGLITCHCGADVSRGDATPACQELYALMDSLRACVLGMKPLPTNARNLPKQQLASMELRSLLSVIRTFGQIRLRLDGNSEKASDRALVTAAAEVLSEWPVNLFRLLREEGMRSTNVGEGGFRSQFASLYSALFKNKAIRNPDDVDFIRSAFLEFVTRRWDKGFVDPKLLRALKGDASKKRYLTQTEFAQRAHVTPVTARRYLRRNETCRGTERGTPAGRILIDSETIQVPPCKPGQILRGRDAARILSLPVTLLPALKKAGVYEVASTFPTRPGYHVHDLHAFRRRLLSCTNYASPPVQSDREIVRLGELLGSPHHSTPSKVRLIESLLEGAIIAIGSADGTIQGLLLERRTMKAWLEAERILSHGGTMSSRQAADALNCDSMCIPWLIGNGFLQGSETSIGLRVREASLWYFLTEWMSLASLARSMSTSSRKLIRVCDADALPLMQVPGRAKRGTQPFIRRNLASSLTSTKSKGLLR